MIQPKTRDLTTLLAPHGPYWAIEPVAAKQLLGLLRATSIEVHMADVEARGPASGSGDKDFQFDAGTGIAYISIVGPMTKATSSMSSGTGTVAVRRQVRAAMNDTDVRGVIMRIDSPGGSVAGTADLARDVAALTAMKPTYAYCEDSCCSAAYWVASQCSRIYAGSTAMVGSIGTLLVLEDWSKAYDAAGVKTLVISTGPNKGAGVEGAPIEGHHLAEFQKIVDDLNSHFLGAVSAGRRIDMDATMALADGCVHVGQEAMDRGLVDDICSLDDAVSDLMGACQPARAGGYRQVSGEAVPRGGLALADESISVLDAVERLTTRALSYKALKEKEGRPMSQGARDSFQSNLEAMEKACGTFREILSETGDADLRQSLDDVILRAELATALS